MDAPPRLPRFAEGSAGVGDPGRLEANPADEGIDPQEPHVAAPRRTIPRHAAISFSGRRRRAATVHFDRTGWLHPE
jgi:hypothetical protein